MREVGMSVKKNWDKIQNEIKATCQKIGRKTNEVTVVAVSKKKPVERVLEALDCEIRNFGENYPQELTNKMRELKDKKITWHFIGRLQSKKIKDIVGKVDLIHSVSRLKELHEIQKNAEIKGVSQKILLQINLSKESSKSGVYEENLLPLIEEATLLTNVELNGLMVMPPLSKHTNDARFVFKRAKTLMVELSKDLGLKSFHQISMGTSGDYLTAIEEGATIVRLGTILLGPREEPIFKGE